MLRGAVFALACVVGYVGVLLIVGLIVELSAYVSGAAPVVGLREILTP